MSDQNRQLAYQYLVEQLLRGSGDEARELLRIRQDLVDIGLVQYLKQESQNFTQQSNWYSAQLLETIAINLEVALSYPLVECSPTEALIFLQNLLLETVASKGDRTTIYSLLEANRKKLNLQFARFLERWGERVVPILSPSQYLSTASAFWYLGDLIQDFPSTPRAINLEIALVCYEIALKFAPPGTPGWVILLPNLGNVYSQRAEGNLSQNIEIAIRCYEDVLVLYEQASLDEKWLIIRNNLGKAYSKRIKGGKSENLEQAIKCYQDCLRFYDQRRKPLDIQWAHIQNDLAIAYRHRLKDERALNLEQAVECYQKALKIYPQLSVEWGNTQNNLAISYCLRVYSSRIENLRSAIDHYEKALQVRTREAHSEKWAATKINMGNAYRNLAEIEQPIPHEIRGEYLKQAIDCYQDALSAIEPEVSTKLWFNAKLNLGNAYTPQSVVGISGKNLQLAIEHWEEILQVASSQISRENWAMVQNNLAVAYRKLADERSRASTSNERLEFLRLAVNRCQLALQVRTDEDFPQEYAETQGNLGMIYKLADRLLEAYIAFDSAINTIERLRGEITSGDLIKQKLVEKFHGLYEGIIEICLTLALKETQYYARAIEYVERSKARSLVENVAHSQLLPKVPNHICDRYQQIRRELIEEQYRVSLENDENYNNTADRTRLNQLRQTLTNLVVEEIQTVDANFSFTQRVQPIAYEEIVALLRDDSTAIIEWYMMGKTFLAFTVISGYEHPLLWQSSPEDLENLKKWGTNYWQDYGEKGKLKENISSRLQELAEILHIDEVLQHIPANCNRLVLIPHRFLHLLPLHALPQSNGVRLLDRFRGGVSYSPSCQLLQLTPNLQQSSLNKLFAIQNPAHTGESLVFSDVEVGCIRSLFHSSHVLPGNKATKEVVNTEGFGNFHCVHFSCHGYFDWEFPTKSALILAGAKDNQFFGETDLKKCLTLSEVFGLDLRGTHLVTLSACETGLVDIRSFVDEYVGLPNGFLVAGSSSVVSSLWTVNDASTCLLMVKFYENLIKHDRSESSDVVTALNQAQRWLRDLTLEELEIFLENHEPQIEQTFSQLSGNSRKRFEENLKQIRQRQPLPFANPFYWAAFTAAGHY